MTPSAFRVRRATVDDRPGLLALWASMHFPVAELDRRLTEFQVVEAADGALIGALAIEVIGRHGRLHSEAFADFAHADAGRERLWERMQSVAANRGLARIWTSESAPFWKSNGFQLADAETLKKLAPAWAAPPRAWLTMQLRDEEALRTSLETDFSHLFKEEKERTARKLRLAKIWNNVGVAIVILVAIAGVMFCIYLLRQNPNLLRH